MDHGGIIKNLYDWELIDKYLIEGYLNWIDIIFQRIIDIIFGDI